METIQKKQSNTRLITILSVATAILCTPLVAMQFTKDVNWSLSDFIIAGFLLYGAGLILETLLRKFTDKTTRFVAAAILLLILALIWVELAVGIFGTPLAGS